MSAESMINDSLKGDDDFSVIERLADAIRIEEDIQISQRDREEIIQDLYEGPKKCQCCINWMDECPHGVDLTELNKDEDEDSGNPLIIRRRVNAGRTGTVISIHSIEIRHAATRKVLIDVFQPYDNIVHRVKYLTFLAPFHQFFWRWESFEKAVAEEKDETVKKILTILRGLVKRELAGAFAVNKELVSHGVITFNYLWILFAPGELIYSADDSHDRFYVLRSCSSRDTAIDLSLSYIAWGSGSMNFGTAHEDLSIDNFRGTRSINSLPAFPAKYLRDFSGMQAKLVERGQKYASLAGTHYKAYHPEGQDTQADLRVMVDASHRRVYLSAIIREDRDETLQPLFSQYTDLINQSPVDSPPPGGVHIPLEEYIDEWDERPRGGRRPLRNPRRVSPYCPPVPPRRRSPAVIEISRRRRSVSPEFTRYDADTAEHSRKLLTDFHLQLTDPEVDGFDLKEKTWRSFEVDRIHDIKWNTKPFESLVLPDGYKDLILAFVESQVKEKIAFDDVINGKGGGLVALLAGDPGVGKTLTAESVAEKIQAPLFKMELGDYHDDEREKDDARIRYDRDRSLSPRPRDSERSMSFTTAFELAARWGAVLLIDECDMYLEKRSDASSKRNRLVSRFLKELEYYPSLLFLTTNRERSLDPAIYSRVHLNINYPALDEPSRLKIWQTFLEKNNSTMSDGEFQSLSKIDVNGRRIRNIVKTAGIMASRDGRSVSFDDVRKVMKITEGVDVESPM
ncbi:hypothetical protein CORC01_13202 [Colletotrichum orchidophilum]|uniref:AAA+ ATPase domain-containing protein n=1 Tax=Colletotrichum orchidophilum TaxID=1209926 RepID=A0A1G4AQX8_9PEZI|nr:uncharacterized protein CORC01_13202 [Colletotrichum orchidophilum]OHE91506.1 hypothetical protein CORC01_13202 [Colletotrichum orchidophilum]